MTTMNTPKHTPLNKAVHAIPMLYAEAFAGSNNKEFVVELYNDARLLEKAAPAMYEALVKAMVLIDIAALEEENRAYRGEQQPITSEARDRQHLAQAALAQAEGSKP